MADLDLNRRKYKRYTLHVKLFMTRVDDVTGRGIPVEVLDISKAGIGFFCTDELVNGAIYRANIKIWTGDIIPAFINVVRVSHEPNGNIYGGVFIGMPEADSCRIEVYEAYFEHNEKEGHKAQSEEQEKVELSRILGERSK